MPPRRSRALASFGLPPGTSRGASGSGGSARMYPSDGILSSSPVPSPKTKRPLVLPSEPLLVKGAPSSRDSSPRSRRTNSGYGASSELSEGEPGTLPPRQGKSERTGLAEAPDGTCDPLRRCQYTIAFKTGWKATVSSESRRTYNQGLCLEYARDGRRVKNMLASAWGTSGTMRDTKDGSDTVAIEPVEKETAITLTFYASQDQYQCKNKLILDGAFASEVVPVRTVSPTGITIVIDVHDSTDSRTIDQVATIVFTSTDELRLCNIQGDVLPGLPKALEYFYYFQIVDVNRFKAAFNKFILTKIVTSADVVFNKPPSPFEDPNHPFRGLNVAFTSLGLQLFGIDPKELGDDAFVRGQLADSRSLGDLGSARGDVWSPSWDPEYKADIHGIFLITAYSEENAQRFIKEIEDAFKWAPRRSSLRVVVNLHGYLRPGAQAMNDPFGWRGGGFTNPQVKGVTFVDEVRYTGTPVIPMGVVVIGREGDEDASKRPAWALDGSLLVTRKLNCLVPEFEEYLATEGPRIFPLLSPEAAADKLGARLMGRWKNGTSIEMSPDHNAPEIASDDKRVNNFEFDQRDTTQQRCPFAAHMRKSNPRNDVPPSERLRHLIRRHNMPYGPEVTPEERHDGTIDDRGLHFCAYQSSIERGFRFIQREWYNKVDFPPNKTIRPGWDPLFGQTGADNKDRFMSGVDPEQPGEQTTFFDKFIDPRGGEYFFSPSMSTLRAYMAE